MKSISAPSRADTRCAGTRCSGTRCSGTSRALRIVAIAALVAAAPLVAVFAASPASSATSASVDLQSGAASLKASGNTWMLAVQYASSGNIGVSIERFVTGNKGYELHSWSARTPGSSFAFSSSTGKATLSSGKSLSPVASFKVSFVPTKKAVIACTLGPSETIFTGTLKGSVHLVSGTRPVSVTLSSASASFSHGANTLTVNPCLYVVPCTGLSWSAPESRSNSAAGSISAAGLGIYTGTHVQYWTTVVRETVLSKTSGLTRTDGASVEVPEPKWDAAAKTLKVGGSSSASGIVTGSGTLTGVGAGVKFGGYCTASGKKMTDFTIAYDLSAKLSKWKKFVAKTSLTGTLTASSTGTGGFAIETVL